MNESNTPYPPLSAAVLAGGMSTRMGVDKALVSLRPGDPPMAALVIERLRAIAADVMLVASDRPEYEQFGVRVIADRFPGSAALGGIGTALAEAQFEHCLVVACDMPFLSHELLHWMAMLPRNYDALIPRLPGESRQGSGFVFQTLHAIYGRRCLTEIETQLETGNKQVIGFFDKVRVQEISLDQVRRLDPHLRSFFNANTPEAAEQARVWLSEGRQSE